MGTVGFVRILTSAKRDSTIAPKRLSVSTRRATIRAIAWKDSLAMGSTAPTLTNAPKTTLLPLVTLLTGAMGTIHATKMPIARIKSVSLTAHVSRDTGAMARTVQTLMSATRALTIVT